MRKGTVVLVPFPFTDLSGQKVRPCVVLHTRQRGEDCVVLFLSSRVMKKRGRFDIRVAPSRSNGLKVESVLKVEKIATLHKKIILGALGTLEPKYVRLIDARLKQLLHLS